jgi:8-amino-7-oxononanoate synthase
VKAFFTQLNLDCGQSESHIIPWIIGDAATTLLASRLLEEQGILAATIRPPSVPTDRSRIRFCLTAEHSDEDIAALMAALQHVSEAIR